MLIDATLDFSAGSADVNKQLAASFACSVGQQGKYCFAHEQMLCCLFSKQRFPVQSSTFLGDIDGPVSAGL